MVNIKFKILFYLRLTRSEPVTEERRIKLIYVSLFLSDESEEAAEHVWEEEGCQTERPAGRSWDRGTY